MKYSPLIMASLWAYLLAALMVLSGCDSHGHNHPHSNGNHELPSVATVRLGNTARTFSSRDIERCTLQFSAPTGGRLLHILFRNGESGLQLQIGSLRQENGTALLVSGNRQSGDLLVAVGTDPQRYHYRLQALASNFAKCHVRHSIYNGIVRANFKCDKLANSMQEYFPASGELSCRLDRGRFS